MSDQYLGEVRLFAGNFAPKGWALCQGQLMPIQQNQALFSLLGTTYGGNGTVNFGLPDFRGRFPISWGSSYVWGQKAGSPTVTLTSSNLPVHTHPYQQPISTDPGTLSSPANAYPATVVGTNNVRGQTLTVNPYLAGTATGAMGGTYNTDVAGSSLPLSVQNPYVAVSFIIALTGIFPSRT